MASTAALVPTFYGHIASTHDGLLLFEACLSGVLNHVARRPHDRERAGLIRSGNVFIYEEHSSGIKRWTDGVPWSPSRILGNFLVYRELERPFPPGEKKRAMKRSKRPQSASKAAGPYGGPLTSAANPYSTSTDVDAESPSSPMRKETERSLIGSLVDSYGFKEDGLVKKTVSVTVGGVSHHMVSYYTIADVMNNKFTTPSKDPRFQFLVPRADLITKQNFRAPIDEIEAIDSSDDGGAYNPSVYDRSGYDMAISRPTSLPTQTSYLQNMNPFQSYGMNSDVGMYEGFTAANSTQVYNQEYGPTSSMYSCPTTENHSAGGYRQQRNSAAVLPYAARRGTSFDHYPSVNSPNPGLSTFPDEPKHTHSASYPTPSFYGGLRDAANIVRAQSTQRQMPILNIYTSYERPIAQQYANVGTTVTKENIWPAGNASTGHGHYTGSQSPWASTGTS